MCESVLDLRTYIFSPRADIYLFTGILGKIGCIILSCVCVYTVWWKLSRVENWYGFQKVDLEDLKISSLSLFKNFKIYFIDYAITVVPFSSLYSPPPAHPLPPSTPSLSSCPWVIRISSLASTFPILFLTFPCLFHINHLCYSFPVHFPYFRLPTPAANSPLDLHFCDSVPVPVVSLVCFCFLFVCF